MNRRDFTQALGLGAATFGLGTALPAAAQGGPVEGQHYVRLGQRQPTQDPKKIEVVEFFWYGCPHCAQLEPMLETWIKKLPPDVLFRRAPVAFREQPYVLHQKLYYAIEQLGLIDTLHKKVFYAIHVERNMLDKPETILDFVAKNGVDKAKFADTMNSFSVQTKARQAAALSAGYRIDGTPALGVNGQFWTSGAIAGGHDRSLQVADFLIAESRQRG